MKSTFLFLLFFLCGVNLLAQDSITNPADSTLTIDSLPNLSDSSILVKPTTAIQTPKVLKAYGEPHSNSDQQIYFYIIAALFLYLGILKTAYWKYLNNMIRVFFNTSLRQMQLTDQLLIAQLPSLLFNIFFIMVGGTQLFLLLTFFHTIALNPYLFWLYCVMTILCIYLVKYLSIRFTGWVTGFSSDAGAYMFIVFLVNKILALILLPLIAFISFSDDFLRDWAVYASLIIILLAFILRYLRSYGLMREKHKISFFHFLLYILAVEVLPIMLLFHFGMEILNKNL